MEKRARFGSMKMKGAYSFTLRFSYSEGVPADTRWNLNLADIPFYSCLSFTMIIECRNVTKIGGVLQLDHISFTICPSN